MQRMAASPLRCFLAGGFAVGNPGGWRLANAQTLTPKWCFSGLRKWQVS